MKPIFNMMRSNATLKNKALSIFLFTALILSGCSKDDDKPINPENLTPDSFNGKITATVENGAQYEDQISKVWALFDAKVNSSNELTGRMLSDGDFSDGGFSINLNEIPSTFLMDVQSFFTTVLGISNELEYSDPDVRLLNAEFFGISSDDKFIDQIIFTTTGSKRTTCLFVFSEDDVTVTGGKTVGVMLRQGWNRIYWTSADKKVTSIVPSGLKWQLSK
jgi:hypothetical protein